MMKHKLVGVILMVLVCWYVYEPIPVGVSRPWKLRALSLSYKLLSDIYWFCGRLQIGTFHENVNWILAVEGSSDARIQSLEFDGVRVRTYNVGTHRGKGPALVYYHGGGWVLSSPEHYDGMMLEILDELDIVIISVAYRLADGKIKFPVPLDDCVIATKYFITHADQFNVDPERVAIGGDSAGGNLAAAVALRLRDEMFQPRPKLQVLIYPMLQAIDFALPSMLENVYSPIISRFYMALGWSMYGMGTPEYAKYINTNIHTSSDVKKSLSQTHNRYENMADALKYSPHKEPNEDNDNEQLWDQMKKVMLNPYFCPLLAEDVYDLPETYIYTAQADSLRDEGTMYAKRIRDANIPVTHIHGETSFHGVCTINGFEEHEHCIKHVINFLKNKL